MVILMKTWSEVLSGLFKSAPLTCIFSIITLFLLIFVAIAGLSAVKKAMDSPGCFWGPFININIIADDDKEKKD